MYGTPLQKASDKFIEENGGSNHLLYLRGLEVVQGEVVVVVMGPRGFWDWVRLLRGRFEPKTYFGNQHNGEIIMQLLE